MQNPPPPGGPGYPYPPSPYAGGPPGYPPPPHGYPPPPPGYGVCPRCHSPHVRKPSWTWWGGFIGPSILNHWECQSCRYGFNPKTGRSTSGAIGIYFAVVMAIGIVLAVLLVAMRRF